MVSTQVNIPGYQVNAELYDGSRTLVYRAVREIDSKSVIIKLLKNPYPSFSELVQFRNQYTIAKNLNFPGIIQTYSIEPYQNGYGLVMEDFGGISLKQDITIKQQSLIEFLQLAISLCDILDFLIRNRIIHKDIKPANILINTETKQVKLIDFSIASLLPRETQTLISPNILEGTLAYISPEQTGRMNRGIDYRTDFYSLGVTFYELLTGELPFQSNDAMQLVHCHIAKTAPFVNEINLKIPAVISEIVSKLMAKNAEERYQSALGLKYDLEKCYLQLKETGAIEDFAIAQRDVSDRFIIPDKLYGRETEVETLLQAFDRVSTGTTEMMLVAGFSGIGKTAVVNEVHKPIVRQRGYFIKGKYDQFNRNIPFSAFVQAFRDLMGQLLTESDAQIQAWKSNILAALGENAQVIIEVIPELERIIGKQPPAIELSGTAAENRFNLLFQKFTQVFTRLEHPLVMFLDDLQWADSASLKLMQLLMADTAYLFIIGAYRDNEVQPGHPLILTLSDIQKTPAIINTITLAPLNLEQINQLVADTLKCTDNLALPLSRLVFQKTKGNPFFATHFIKALYEDELIHFNYQQGYWQCDIAELTQKALTDDVVEFMAQQLRKLPDASQEMIKIAACLGNKFDLETLAVVAEKSAIETATCLWKVLQEGLILPISDIYKFYQGENNDGFLISNENLSRKIAKYQFLHDRVQQAAYFLIPDAQKTATHLKIGKLLLKNSSEIDLEEKLFDIVGHLNLGQELISQPSERQTLAQLNLKAGVKARNSTAYPAARAYLQIGIDLLQTNCWQHQYELTLNLYLTSAEVSYLNGDFERMEQQAALVLQQAQTVLDKVKIYEIQIAAQTLQSNVLEAINIGRTALLQLGVELPKEPHEAEIGKALQTLATQLGNMQVEALVDLPLTTDAVTQSAMHIMGILFAPIIQGMPGLLPLLSSKMVSLSLQSGNTVSSTIGYALHGLVMSAFLADAPTGYAFGKVALNLLEKFNTQKIKSNVMFLFGNFIQPHKEPLRESIQTLKVAYQAGIDTGDFMHAGFSLATHSNSRFFSGEELDSFVSDMANYSLALAQVKQYSAQAYVNLGKQTAENLIEPVSQPHYLIGNSYNETAMLIKHQQDNDQTAIAEAYIYKLLLAYCFGNYPDAINYVAQAQLFITAVSGSIFVTIFHFYAALTHLTRFINQPEQEQAEILAVVQIHQTNLHQSAQNAPMNHLHKWYLIEAESHRVRGEKILAIECYDKAITLAKENKFLHEEAISNELAAKFYLDWGKEKVAAGYMQEAYYCYAKWGAKAKTDDLEKRYPQLLAPILQSATRSSHKETLNSIQDTVSHSTSSSSNFLDLDTIFKISQSFTSEIHLERLVEQVMQAVVANAGADKGALILNHQDNLVVVCQYVNQQVYPFEIQPLDSCINLPLSIINYVKRTLELTIASVDIPHIFAADVYFSHHSPQSLLCTPILKQGQLIALLYLENSLTCEAFTSERLEMLNLLCTQAAISLENASLYNTLEQKVIERTRELSQALNDLKATQKKLVEAEKMAALGGLVAGVAHEINTPVGVGITLASTLVEQTKIFQDSIAQGQLKKSVLTSYLDTAAECSNLILTNLQRAGELIQSFKQVAVDQSNLEQRTILLKSYVEEILTSMSPQLRQAGHNLTVTGDENIELYTYPGAIAQLLVNLLTNSLIHAYPDGNPGNLAIHISQVEQNVILTYSDDGCGIPREALGKIFEPFFTTARSRGGSGLGLHIVYNLVTQKLGGAIDVDSQLGEGTFFTITLPHSC